MNLDFLVFGWPWSVSNQIAEVTSTTPWVLSWGMVPYLTERRQIRVENWLPVEADVMAIQKSFIDWHIKSKKL